MKLETNIKPDELDKYKEVGFYLKEPDDHLVELWFKDKLVGVYNQHTFTIKKASSECKNFMEKLNEAL